MSALQSLSHREAFVADQIAAIRRAGGYTLLEPYAAGYRLDKRPYVALPCHCRAADCPGFAMVRDDPAARHHFNKLFGPRP